jgi:CheY-like chemotaxis protein
MSKKCLIVDDVEVSRYVISELMEEFGFACKTAADMKEAMATLDQERFDVILLDWHLRKVSGLEMVPSIRSHVNGGSVPVIVCTGVETDKELADIEQSGVQALVKKPTSRENLQQELTRLHLL